MQNENKFWDQQMKQKEIIEEIIERRKLQINQVLKKKERKT
jgi:hypothetical protein